MRPSAERRAEGVEVAFEELLPPCEEYKPFLAVGDEASDVQQYGSQTREENAEGLPVLDGLTVDEVDDLARLGRSAERFPVLGVVQPVGARDELDMRTGLPSLSKYRRPSDER